MQRGVVEENSVRDLAVLAEAFAVIAEDCHQGVRFESHLLEAGEEAADLLVHVGDFTGVGIARVEMLIGLGRIVGRVRIEVVRPEEEFLPLVMLQPVEGELRDCFGAAFRRRRRAGCRRPA